MYRNIIAKFPSFCKVCNTRIQVGDPIKWDDTKREPTKHVSCVLSDAPTAPRMRKKGTSTGCACGSVNEFSKKTDCWTCKHDSSDQAADF